MRIERTFQLGDPAVRIETGEIDRQATGAVLRTMQGTVAASRRPRHEKTVFPLTVDHDERASAAGRIPRCRDRREGLATERETLVSRLIDRSFKPLFLRGSRTEIQVVTSAARQLV